MDKKLLWLIFSVTRGGHVRAEMVYRLKDHPSNANQLSKELKRDYKTIKHHLGILMQHNILEKIGGRYSAMYALSPEIESSYADFLDIYERQRSEASPGAMKDKPQETKTVP